MTSRHVFRPRPARTKSNNSKTRADVSYLLDDEVPLQGFKPATSRLSSVLVYPPPKVPPNFSPFHVFLTAGPAFSQHKVPGKPSNLSAEQRMSILGEQALPGPKTSVFDYLKEEDKARLLGLQANSSAADSSQPNVGNTYVKTDNLKPRPPPHNNQNTPAALVPPPPKGMSSKIAKSPGMFRPFEKDPAKEERYHRYLDGLPIDNRHLHPEDQLREIDAFVKAAQLYRPMNNSIANRFARGSGIVIM